MTDVSQAVEQDAIAESLMGEPEEPQYPAEKDDGGAVRGVSEDDKVRR
jgi:hypothetical protein